MKCVLRQQMPEKPSTSEFLALLQTALEHPSGPAADTALFGEFSNYKKGVPNTGSYREPAFGTGKKNIMRVNKKQ